MEKDSKYGPKDRKRMEANETSNVVETDLPTDRFSGKVQYDNSMETVTPASQVMGSGDKKELAAKQLETIKSKVKIRPASSDKVLTDTQVGGVPIGSGQAVTMSAAGGYTKSSTVVDGSRIPYTDGGYRPDSRQAKKTSDNDFIINNAISEQVVPEFEGTKDLRHAPNSLQGYNGQKQFKIARGKKNAGTIPQSTLYDRSIDFQKVDSTVHTTGQVLDNIDPQSDYPTRTALNNFEMGAEGYDDIANPMHKSNYILKSFKFSLSNGRLSSVSFDEDCVPAHINDQNTYQANQNWQIDRNNVTKTMIRLQKELGRETTDKWSPLGYVIDQPYEYNMLAHDIEATTGAMQLLAYRAVNSSLAFQSHNKLAKDGAKPQSPILEMFLDGIGQTVSSIDKETLASGDINQIIFSDDFCRKGSASAIIKMFDSTSKYTTKANFFNLPRSLKYFVQTMDNNINPLHCKKEFLMAVDTAHVFSTFDGNYNPMLPIVATDKISIVNPLSLNFFLRGWSRDKVTSENMSGTASPYAYKYKDLRNVYRWEVKHPIVEGLLSWMIKHESALAKAYGRNAEVEIPCFYSMLAPSMFQILLSAASQEILWARQIYFRDFLFAGEQTEYIWKDLESLDTLNPKFSSNFKLTDYKEAIDMGKMKPASFYNIFWSEQYQVMTSKDPAVGTKEQAVFLPWYQCEDSFKSTFDDHYGFYKDNDHQYTMCYPETRIGVCHDYIDEIYAVDERDLRLSLDRAIGIPFYHVDINANDGVLNEGEDYHKYTLPEYITEDSINDGNNVTLSTIRYDKNSDGRVIAMYKNESDNRFLPNKAGIMALPRELGFLYPHFRVSPIIKAFSVTPATNNTPLTVTIETTGNYRLSSQIDGSTGYSLVSYAAKGNNNDGISISRTAAIQQDYITYFADRSSDVIDINANYISKTGMIPATSGLLTNAESNDNTSVSALTQVDAFYALDGSAHTQVVSTEGFVTFSSYYWTMLNRMFMPVNVYENTNISVGTKDDTSAPGVLVDPFETSFMFGLSGFFASDFSQDVLNRADIIDQLNLDYTEDEFIKSSLIFRAN